MSYSRNGRGWNAVKLTPEEVPVTMLNVPNVTISAVPNVLSCLQDNVAQSSVSHDITASTSEQEENAVITNDVNLSESSITVDVTEPLVPFVAPNVQVVHPIVREPDTERESIDWELLDGLLHFNVSPGSGQQQSVQEPDFNQEEFDLILQSLREPILDAEFDEFNAYLNL